MCPKMLGRSLRDGLERVAFDLSNVSNADETGHALWDYLKLAFTF